MTKLVIEQPRLHGSVCYYCLFKDDEIHVDKIKALAQQIYKCRYLLNSKFVLLH